MKTLNLIIFGLFVGVVTSEKLYENYKAYDLIANCENSLDLLNKWQDVEGVDFWKYGSINVESRVMIPPSKISEFEEFLKTQNIQYKIRSENVGEIEDEFEQEKLQRLERLRLRKLANPSAVRPNFDVYWTSEEIDIYCQYLANTYPQRVIRERLVQTFEGNEVFALKISKGGFGGKPIIFIDAGMHAREWVSQATIVYFLYRLIEDESVANELLDNVDWIIIPNLNPDGYNWSFNEDRMWRKNRNFQRDTCRGVDLNRNFAFNWRGSNTGLCSQQTFPGTEPLSEVESRALNNYMTRYRANVKFYMSVHSFGDMMLWPWGYSGSPGRINNWEHHQLVGNMWADAIRNQTGKSYRVGNTAEVLGTAFGASDDHMAGEQLVNLVYTAELTGGGRTGFDFPESEIEALNHETFWGYRAFGLYVKQNYRR